MEWMPRGEKGIAVERIPVASADLSGNEEAYVVDAIRSSWISSAGLYVNRFEAEFAALCGTTNALGVCNGTVALHLALLGMDVRPGDEVLVPSLTYVATANAVRYVGAEPVFVDVDPATWCIDPGKLADAITPRTRGIIAVHLLGHPADMDEINRTAAVHGLWVVEDAAEAHLARYKGRVVGSLAKVATFSFFGNKLFTCGEGGAITLSDAQLEVRMRILRGQGMDPQQRVLLPGDGVQLPADERCLRAALRPVGAPGADPGPPAGHLRGVSGAPAGRARHRLPAGRPVGGGLPLVVRRHCRRRGVRLHARRIDGPPRGGRDRDPAAVLAAAPPAAVPRAVATAG